MSAPTGSAKARTVLDTLDSVWTLPSRLADNPLEWMIEVNGLIVVVRYAPGSARRGL